MYLVAPHGKKRKWDIRVRIHDGRIVKIPGDRDRNTAQRIGQRLALLVRAKVNGDGPPVELRAWIDNMPESLSSRLVELGLLEQRRLTQTKALVDHIDDFQQVVAGRRSNSAEHAKEQAAKVRRMVKKLGITNFADLTEDTLAHLLLNLNRSLATRRHYIVAMKDFAKWMSRVKRANENPLANMRAPGQYENPEIERQPLNVQQFQKLMKYLDTFERYPHQKTRWTAADRKLVYWTAVKTGFRRGEMMSMRKAHLLLDQSPALVCIKAADAKNKTRGMVPIPADLAAMLRPYVADLDAADLVFPFPTSDRGVIDMFRRDLKGAGIPWQLETGEIVDFHTLRSTAITWWLDVDGLSAKRVQVLARLKTLALVANYSRNYRMEDFGWLNKGPKLVSKPRRKTA